MDYFKMTAPCGLDCFNCDFYLAHKEPQAKKRVEHWSEKLKIPFDIMLCQGCRAHDGLIPLQKHIFGDAHQCSAYECSKSKKVDFCGDCDQFPCDHLHPYADKAGELPHNIKVFNLCLIKRMGLEKWATTKAPDVRQTYFTDPWTLDNR